MEQQENTTALAAMPKPAYLMKYAARSGNFMDDFGLIEPSDWGLNFLKIVQATEIHGKPGWGPNGNEPAMPQGTYVLNRTHRVVPPDSIFVPVLRSVTFIRFKGKKTSDGILYMTKDPNDPRIVKENGLAFREDPNTGQREAPLVTKFVNFYIMTEYNWDEPAIISFHRTSTKRGSELTKAIAQATGLNGEMAKLPMYCCMFRLREPSVERDGTQTWYQPRCAPSGFTAEKHLEHLEKMREMALFMDRSSADAQNVVGATDDHPEPEQPRTPDQTAAAAQTLSQAPLTAGVQLGSTPTQPQFQPQTQAQPAAQPEPGLGVAPQHVAPAPEPQQQQTQQPQPAQPQVAQSPERKSIF